MADARKENHQEDNLPQTVSVLVTGDIVIDHHIYEGNRHYFGDVSSNGVVTKNQMGGAAILAAVLDHLGNASERNGWTTIPDREAMDDYVDLVGEFGKEDRESQKGDPAKVQEAYAFWRPKPEGRPRADQFWRVAEAMGFGIPTSPDDQDSCRIWPDIETRDGLSPEIIAISEGGMGFREAEDCWKELDFENAKHIILKSAAPFAEGKLWQHLIEQYSQKLTIVISADDIRKSTARISSGLSWDETLADTLRELRKGGALESLTTSQHVIISYGSEGALWFDVENQDIQFVFEPSSIEHELEYCTEGTAFGLLTAMTAAVVRTLATQLSEPSLNISYAEALSSGLSAMQTLRKEGHGPANEVPQGFPAQRVSDSIQTPSVNFTRTSFSLDSEISGSSILKSIVRREGPEAPAFEVARLTAIYGNSALENFPHLRIGALFTADRGEVESLRVLTQVIRRYQDHDAGKKPLSIGVFGPPGAGKSFAVKQLAKMLFKENGAWLEFNLSQFSDPEELNGAFHQIRDQVLKGKCPVAFFDEFDSRKFHWLQYLLAPMQDGRFQEGQLTHTLGKAVFVFAGGTSWTFETLGPSDESGDESALEDFRLSKGPDFKSRLDAYLDVLGPNQRFIPLESKHAEGTETKPVSGHLFTRDTTDICFPIRRALMIRNLLGCKPGEVLKIDDGLLNAILRGPDLKHGARSLSKIVEVIKTGGKGKLLRSFLPPDSQLKMHTENLDEFMDLLTLPSAGPEAGEVVTLSKEQAQVIAPAIHDTWRDLGRMNGWLAPADDQPLDEISKVTEKELEEINKKNLPEEETRRELETLREMKDFKVRSNTEAALRMPRNLAIIGLQLNPGENTEKETHEIRTLIECHLELMAYAEHKGWMDFHIHEGWRKGPKKDPKQRTHPCLISYPLLPEHEKNKDRETVRLYPEFAKRAGMKITT